MKWETYGNLGCRTLPCCPQYTSSFPYFNYLVFFPPPWRRKHKLKLLISEINSWMQYQSQPHATGLSGPSDPFQFSGGSPSSIPVTQKDWQMFRVSLVPYCSSRCSNAAGDTFVWVQDTNLANRLYLGTPVSTVCILPRICQICQGQLSLCPTRSCS